MLIPLVVTLMLLKTGKWKHIRTLSVGTYLSPQAYLLSFSSLITAFQSQDPWGLKVHSGPRAPRTSGFHPLKYSRSNTPGLFQLIVHTFPTQRAFPNHLSNISLIPLLRTFQDLSYVFTHPCLPPPVDCKFPKSKIHFICASPSLLQYNSGGHAQEIVFE